MLIEPKNEVERLVHNNMGLVVVQAIRFKPNQLSDLDDFIQAGAIGLFRAAQKYDPNINPKFSCVAWISIKREIIKEQQKNHPHQTLPLPELVEDEIPENIEEYIGSNLSEIEVKVLMMRAYNYKLREIGEEFGHTKQWAKDTLDTIVEKIRRANR